MADVRSINNSVLVAEVITGTDAKDFCLAIENTLLKAPQSLVEEVYFFLENRRTIAFSFDGNWRPFICTTRGFNYPEDRIYLNGGGAFVALIRSRMRNLPHEMAGGRVFLEEGYAYRVENGHKQKFLRYIWLGRNLDLTLDMVTVLAKVMRYKSNGYW